MKIIRTATGGAAEKSDALVTVAPLEGELRLEISSIVGEIFGEQIEECVRAALKEWGVESGQIRVEDKGALDYVLRARLRTALCRGTQEYMVPAGQRQTGCRSQGIQDANFRSLLFLPGNNPNMLINGDFLGSDAVIIDLEDAVDAQEKDAARMLVRGAVEFLRYQEPIIVRINGLDTPEWQRDLEEILAAGVSFIMLPKANTAEDIHTLDGEIGRLEQRYDLPQGSTRILPLIETAEGILHAYEIAKASPRVLGVALGGEDLSGDLHCQRTPEGGELLFGRQQIVHCARAAGVECFDTPYPDARDLEGAKRDAAQAQSMGFSGKLVISPGHVDLINQVFSPSPDEIAHAAKVLEAIEEGHRKGLGVVSMNGKMVDKPVADRARRILKMARKMGVKE